MIKPKLTRLFRRNLSSKNIPVKNILIVTENFTYGGLETHILGEIKNLYLQGHNIHLMVTNEFSDILLQTKYIQNIDNNLRIVNPDMSIRDLINATTYLQAYIKENNIDLVHAHPFMTLLPACLAAYTSHKAFVLTLHGPGSVKGVFGSIYDKLNYMILNNSAVVVVSEEVRSILAKDNISKNIFLLPNAIGGFDVRRTKNTQKTINKKCLIVSRLDSPKVNGIRNFISVLHDINNEIKIEIAGDGPEKNSLLEWCASRNISIKFLGKVKNVQKIMPQYDFIGGMGRVVLEAISVQKPVCLIGYDGAKGFVCDKKKFVQFVSSNLSGRGFENIKKNELRAQLNQLGYNHELYNYILRHYSEQKVWTRFIKINNGFKPEKKHELDKFLLLLNKGNYDNDAVLIKSKHINDMLENIS